jgi:hypothetical protein
MTEEQSRERFGICRYLAVPAVTSSPNIEDSCGEGAASR